MQESKGRNGDFWLLAPGEAAWAIAMLASGFTVEQVVKVITAYRVERERANQNEIERLAKTQATYDHLRERRNR